MADRGDVDVGIEDSVGVGHEVRRAGRVAAPVVRAESLLLEAQSAKKAALTALGEGDNRHAAELLSAAADRLSAESGLGEELSTEARLLEDLAERALEDDVQHLTRFTTADVHSKSTRRGRTT